MWTGSITQISAPTVGTKPKACPAWLLAHIAEEVDARFCPQRYSSISAFFQAHQIPPSRRGPQWRLTDRVVGSINGLPQSFGHLTATNGILCYIENATGIYLGHVQHFEKVDIESELQRTRSSTEESKPKRQKVYSAGEVDMLLE